MSTESKHARHGVGRCDGCGQNTELVAYPAPGVRWLCSECSPAPPPGPAGEASGGTDALREATTYCVGELADWSAGRRNPDLDGMHRRLLAALEEQRDRAAGEQG